jgi:endoglucanase
MKTLLFIFLSISIFKSTEAQYKTVPKDIYDRLLLESKKRLDGRYMVKGKAEIITNLKDWEGIKLEKYTYQVHDKNSSLGIDTTLTATVILYNPSYELVVKWVINALLKAGIKPTYKNTNQVLIEINKASNAQFPVRGIVYEDLTSRVKNVKDGLQETYAFFDGVTIECKGISITTYDTNNNRRFTNQRATKAQADKYLNMSFNDISSTHVFGRIISTTREDYKSILPNVNTDKTAWIKVVSEEYKKAMKSEENNLIYATIYNDRKRKFTFE